MGVKDYLDSKNNLERMINIIFKYVLKIGYVSKDSDDSKKIDIFKKIKKPR
jgi:hypothetical protein